MPTDDRFGINMFDYTITFWWRSKYDHKTLERVFNDRQMFLFAIDSFGCFISEGIFLTCSQDVESYKIPLIELPDLQSWMHLTF